jgi:2-methylisocitrate lyase-like PEP mutase family enzyme
MTTSGQGRRFRELHHREGEALVLANAWDAGSARVIEACGVEAIATTSSGVAWSCGWPDGNALPPRELAEVVRRIVRVITVPLTVDAEAGYSDDPVKAADAVSAVMDAGAVGVNLEDGSGPPALLCAKIEAAKRAAARAGVDLFVNARTDVFLRGLVAAGERVAETVRRARAYREAGADGIFVPRASTPDDIRALVAGVTLPLNVMVVPELPSVRELAALGVRRVSAGGAIAQAAHGLTRRLATGMLREGTYAQMAEGGVPYGDLNGIFPKDT